MISNVFINKVVAGVYEIHVEHNGSQLGDAQSFDRIENAIRFIAADIPPEFGSYLNFNYGGMCTGTVGAKEALTKASLLADRLVELTADLHRLTESSC